MNAFDIACAELIGAGLEGAYSDDPLDAGNWTGGSVGVGRCKGTKYGISAASYPDLDIKDLTPEEARGIYHQDYWNPLQCDLLPPALASAAFKVGVNIGIGAAARRLQSAVGAAQDGQIGPATLAAISKLPADYALSAFLGDVAFRYAAMAGFAHDGRGWLRRTVLTAIQAGRMK